MVYVEGVEEDGPVRLPGCAPLYRMAQTKWTGKLFWQMALYVTWIVGSMVVGGMLPFILDGRSARIAARAQAEQLAWKAAAAALAGNYTYCPKDPVHPYAPLERGYPAPPLAVNGSDLVETWGWKKVVLRGVSWFGFNNEGGMVDGLWVGGSRADTDFHALAYQIKLLGFNAVRLPFTFSDLQRPGRGQVMECAAAARGAWAKRATDPEQKPQPEFSVAPDTPLHIKTEAWERDLCNTYVPSNETALAGERLLWTLQYLVASGFYVVLDYHPPATDPLPAAPKDFAYAWLKTWAAITCLPNFADDIRGRVVLDLLNEPDLALGGRGIHWQRAGATPGLDELYLTTMDALEELAPGDGLFMVQGSTAAADEGPGGARGVNGFSLTPGDGFVSDPALIAAHRLSDPRPFLDELLQRPYAGRTLLAPHLLPPGVPNKLKGAVPPGGAELFSRLAASWGRLARVGHCLGARCQRFPVIIGEMGSKLEAAGDIAYYRDVAAFAAAGGEHAAATAPIAGWFWWSFNGNSAVTGGIVTPAGLGYNWHKLRMLASAFGLSPWYTDPRAFVANATAAQEEAQRVRDAADSAAAAAAKRRARGMAAAVAALANSTHFVASIDDIVIKYTPKGQAAAAVTTGAPSAAPVAPPPAAPAVPPAAAAAAVPAPAAAAGRTLAPSAAAAAAPARTPAAAAAAAPARTPAAAAAAAPAPAAAVAAVPAAPAAAAAAPAPAAAVEPSSASEDLDDALAAAAFDEIQQDLDYADLEEPADQEDAADATAAAVEPGAADAAEPEAAAVPEPGEADAADEAAAAPEPGEADAADEAAEAVE
ncbi:MAG: hypothetical protein J3K34DRAFT_272387 [Monoraphidium minutum]|nr:MAG: hypothetical protein J3K34DRAFT_272387 [Monoraphidium minutum]